MTNPMLMQQSLDNKRRILAEQLHAYFQQLPAISIAPALGAVFVCWVLWQAVERHYLVIGLVAILIISITRLIIYRLYRLRRIQIDKNQGWKYFSVATAFVSGCIWGSAAVLLYPPQQDDYQVFMLVLLALVPVAPIAALAVHMPNFYAYYVPCVLPFVFTLAMRDTRAEHLTAVLLVMMMGATITFAIKYNKILTDAIRLQLRFSDQKDALQETSRLKTRFMATASHDLRQPLHAIGLFIETLRKHNRDSNIAALVGKIEEATLSLRQMLNAMLDISKLDSGTVEAKRRDFPLHELLDKLHTEFAPIVARKNLSLRYVSTRLVVNSDPILLERILRNLLSNAIKFTERGGIVMGCRHTSQHAHIQIVDSGKGIPSSRLQIIFQEFIQLQQATDNPDKGLGLGLSIVERLAQLLEHRIHVQSALDRGSIFTLSVPRASGTSPSAFNAENTAVAEPILTGIHILLLDDDSTVLSAMQSLLQTWGAEVIAGRTSDELMSLPCAMKQKADLLIVDYHLANGECAPDTIARWRACYGHTLKVLIITGDTSPEHIQQAHNQGYILLHKPVEVNKLRACLRDLFGQTRV